VSPRVHILRDLGQIAVGISVDWADESGDRVRPKSGCNCDEYEFVRIPVMTTMRSGAWRPLDPVDDDQGGA
jgi:hypothetical protein